MSYCGTCGAELGPGQGFCGKCGAPAGDPSSGQPGVAAPGRRTAIWVSATVAVIAVVVGAVLMTRDDGQSETVTTGSAPTNPVTTVPVTTLPATTPPAETTLDPTTTVTTTVAPTTTPFATTTAPTSPPTTLPEIPAGWSSAEFNPQAVPPCCDSNWEGEPSPPVDDAAAPLPDGVYRAVLIGQDGAKLDAEIRRFDLCGLPGMQPCIGQPPFPSDLGVSDDVLGIASIPLDASTRVVISGWDCDPVVAQGNGTDLAKLFAAISLDYDLAFGAGLAAGADPGLMVQDVRLFGAGGFGPPSPACDDGFSLVWRHGTAPPVLVQFPFREAGGGAVDPASLLLPTAIEVDGGQTTVYVYAGFYP